MAALQHRGRDHENADANFALGGPRSRHKSVEWWEEFRRYHRKDGVILKVFDDMMSATRIAIMDHRNAQPEPFDPRTGRRYLGVNQHYRSDFDLLTGKPFATEPGFTSFA